jgi:hypothetical protein
MRACDDAAGAAGALVDAMVWTSLGLETLFLHNLAKNLGTWSSEWGKVMLEYGVR